MTRTGGRPSKFTDNEALLVVGAALMARSIRGCTGAIGVHHETVSNWASANRVKIDANGEAIVYYPSLMDDYAWSETHLLQGHRPARTRSSVATRASSPKSSFGYDAVDRIEIKPVSEDEKDDLSFDDIEAIFYDDPDHDNRPI